MRTYFITGLPRSRTAWLANLMTHGASFCFHEACRHVSALEELPELFRLTESPYVGTADSGFLLYWRKALELFPGAPVVLVRRDRLDVETSCRRLAPDMRLSEEEVTKALEGLELQAAELRLALPSSRLLEVEYEDLDRVNTLHKIWSHCAGGKFQVKRAMLLRELQVQVMPSVLASYSAERLRGVFGKKEGVVWP